MSFEANEGQTDRRVRFLARGQGYSLFLTTDQAVLAIERPEQRSTLQTLATSQKAAVRLKLLGVDANVKVRGDEELPGKANYFIGRDPRGWHTDVPTYAQVHYRGLYRGVDLVYYGRQGKLEYDFVLAPGVDPHRVRFRIEGTDRVRLNGAGELVLETEAGKVILERPQAYQRSGAGKRPVAVRYMRRGRDEFGFEVAGYKHGQPLIIDPYLYYATYLGGSGGDVAYAVGVDSSNDSYVAGQTSSTNFPTLNAYQGKSGGNGDAFVSKLNAFGTALIYSTYLGGSGSDIAFGLAVDSKDDVFLTGMTMSSDFPVAPLATSTSPSQAFQTTYGGNGDAFVTELASTGNTLVYSSYLGGSGADSGQGIAVDSTGNAYVTGFTQSPNFPTMNPYQSAKTGSQNVFITKVNFSGTALAYSTYLGGSEADTGQSIQVDSSGNAYVAGYTFSTNFPVQNAYQSQNAGDADAFITELNPSGSGLVFSTYLGGTGRDRAFGLALDASNNIYVAGDTQSADFPTTPNVFQGTYAGNGDAFVSKLSSGGSSLVYSTFMGGSEVDQGNGIAVDAMGDAAVVGFTQSSDFPTVDPLQAVLNGLTGGSSCGTGPCSDAFVAKLNPSGSQALYSTFLGGSGADYGQAVALDSSGDPYVAGSTSSSNFPAIAGVFQGDLAGVAGNAFVAEISPLNLPAIALTPATLNFGNETESVVSSPLTVTVIDPSTVPLEITSITPPSSDFTSTDTCVGTVAARGGTCTIDVFFTPQGLGAVTDQFTIDDNTSGSPHTFTVTGTGVSQATAVTVSPTSITFPNTNVAAVSAPQTVTITNTGVSTLDITSISVSSNFTETNTCAALLNILNVGQSCSVSIEFAPTASGTLSGDLSISDNATGSPQIVALSGTALSVFSLSSPDQTVSVIIGSTDASFTVKASAASGFTGAITLQCPSGTTCTFSSNPIFSGQSSTVTVCDLTTSTPNPFDFTLSGISGSQTATLTLAVLFETYTLSVSPLLDTVVSGAPANYTLLVIPSDGFNQQVDLSCLNAPAGAVCSFSPSEPTPNGSSPAKVALTISTVQSGSGWKIWPPGRLPPGLMLTWVAVWLVLTLALLIRARRQARHRATSAPMLVALRVSILAVLLLFLLLVEGCRGLLATAPTPAGNYIITVCGELNSNTAVKITTTVDLAVTAAP